MRFELAPTERFGGELHPAAAERPASTVESVVLTRWGVQLWCRDHPDAGRWKAHPAGALICAGCYPANADRCGMTDRRLAA